MTTVTLEELKANAVQYGHKTSKWNPKMKRYLYGSASGIHIFDLRKTAEKLKELLDFLKKASDQGQTILFVSTKPQTASAIRDLAEKTDNPYVTKKWFGGLLTNFDTMKERIRYFKNLREEKETGGFEKYTKQEIAKKNKEIEKLEKGLGGISGMRRLPDVVFIVDCKRDAIAVLEARKLKIPVVGLADSNADPDLMDIAVPANDDAPKSLSFLLGLVGETLKGKKKEAPSASSTPQQEGIKEEVVEENGASD